MKRRKTGTGNSASPDETWSIGTPFARRRLDLLALIPLMAIIALVILVAGVVWIVSRNEAEQARMKLATDALWVEQTLRLQMSVDEDMLARMALEAASGTNPDILDSRARLHIASNPEILSIIWYDNAGQRQRALPGERAPGDDALVKRLANSRTRGARPVYGSTSEEGQATMGLALPDEAGFVTATVSLQLLLQRHVPWWIAEQYGVRIRDMDGKSYAERQLLDTNPDSPSHRISFDPPLHGTELMITAYEDQKGLRAALLFGAIGALAIFAILALAVLYGSSKRRRAAEAQLRSETAFRSAMEESLTVGIRARDHDGRILYVNSAFCDLVGWNSSDLIGHLPPMPYWHPQKTEETRARHEHLARSGTKAQSFETHFLHRDGREIDVQVYEAPLIDSAGIHRGWMGSVIDLTEQKRAARLTREQDETMARTGRLVTLGEMASTLAHELNQPLAAIASYAAGMSNLLNAGNPDPALLCEATGKLGHQADRAGQIIRHIQDLVKKREPRFVETRLDEVINETVSFLSADARAHRVVIQTDLHPVPAQQADRILLEQVLINLIRNGMEAMAEKRHGDAVLIRLYPEGNHSMIEVEDQGCGISDDMAGRLFEAFASTKAQGMGMGLKICRSIIELHRGQLAHRSAADGGTIFLITLPRAEGKSEGKAWAA
ncbi:two-component system sensor histidine kinase NtrB [Paracoccus onubensis]|nr:PAS domain S-box protein [Paracoccus onubensis]